MHLCVKTRDCCFSVRLASSCSSVWDGVFVTVTVGQNIDWYWSSLKRETESSLNLEGFFNSPPAASWSETCRAGGAVGARILPPMRSLSASRKRHHAEEQRLQQKLQAQLWAQVRLVHRPLITFTPAQNHLRSLASVENNPLLQLIPTIHGLFSVSLRMERGFLLLFAALMVFTPSSAVGSFNCWPLTIISFSVFFAIILPKKVKIFQKVNYDDLSLNNVTHQLNAVSRIKNICSHRFF